MRYSKPRDLLSMKKFPLPCLSTGRPPLLLKLLQEQYDLDRGIIVGQRSYGKGLVQITRPLSYNSQLKLTTAKYYIPSGRCIQALDFSHPNEDGSVGTIPDSLVSEFKTSNGRIVKDGGGITPDVEVVPAPLSQISAELYLRNLIFDYATRYYWTHPEPETIEQFTFSDADYSDFTGFLKKLNFSYQTATEESLNDLLINARKEKYFDLHKDLFAQLQKELGHTLEHDLTIFRKELTSLLENEIIVRNRNRIVQGCIRITAGTPSENSRLIAALKKIKT